MHRQYQPPILEGSSSYMPPHDISFHFNLKLQLIILTMLHWFSTILFACMELCRLSQVCFKRILELVNLVVCLCIYADTIDMQLTHSRRLTGSSMLLTQSVTACTAPQAHKMVEDLFNITVNTV